MSATTPRIQALAIVSPKSGPIYVRQFGKTPAESTAADLRYHYFAHASLDVMDERSGASSSSRTSPEQYLGLLYTLEDLAVYGFQTCTRLRFLIMLSLTDHVVRDLDILTLFKAIYTSYLKYSANPFHALPPTSFAPADRLEEEDAHAKEARAQDELRQRQQLGVAINCRQIKSAAFDARIDRIVFGSALKAPAPSSKDGANPASLVAGR
ncbi:Trafficking protein particle complex [Pseudozyma hubeiensis]|nr:Trafficking protein particle complex [Pseudozyma hubeiensis]